MKRRDEIMMIQRMMIQRMIDLSPSLQSILRYMVETLFPVSSCDAGLIRAVWIFRSRHSVAFFFVNPFVPLLWIHD
jgi:hypothetical protein